ncbi:MAG: phage tail protein [Fimbriimonadaceae bacterium]|uniref:T4-like virus tail tube protein gp19 n=1 Tax=Candidatus Nitrosymbiomonas proteolyticus TaxID=2608984 RepID=A0A809RXH1_9BACT|nr:MAG: T4-like virus tail tube protein gp19 [Armatimonadetes bacterium OLB18]MBV6490833.1 hypothetical protein [Fimbriimonadaceae bacterium]NUM38188.1 phage tail protein [Armatimonadota bacterium]QOJ12705.1 MAG: phage tail protein [Chthonomonadaceae bacterium]BBO24612.1 T4-like virus tail tube protein gp19 [Candidatus Nitrosymbiomonas proteolyticus]
MASSQRSKDPHLGLRFWVEVGGIEVAGFSECSGLSIETEMHEYVEGGLNSYTHKLPTRVKYGNITLKHGLDTQQDLFKWFKEGLNGEPAKRKNISIIVYNSTGTAVRRWELMRAYPVKWTGPDLKSDSGAIAVETLELAFDRLDPNK